MVIVMKRFISIAVAAVLFLALSLNAQATNNTNGVIGRVYSTDILADIDGMPIPSYNIGGKTVVAVDDLASYGFDVQRGVRELESGTRPEIRVSVQAMPTEPEHASVTRQKTGRITGNVYSTDVFVAVNGMNCEAYSINGQTVVCIEDLGEFDDTNSASRERNACAEYGYTVYGLKAKWNPEKKTISLLCMRPGQTYETDMGSVTISRFQEIGGYLGQYALYNTHASEHSFTGMYGFSHYHSIIPALRELGYTYTLADNVLSVTGVTAPDVEYKIGHSHANAGMSMPFAMADIAVRLNGVAVTLEDGSTPPAIIHNGELWFDTKLLEKLLNFSYS